LDVPTVKYFVLYHATCDIVYELDNMERKSGLFFDIMPSLFCWNELERGEMQNNPQILCCYDIIYCFESVFLENDHTNMTAPLPSAQRS
jgi:hypothetical protein